MTTLCGIIGKPVKHSLSPVMHNAGYEALGLDFRYEAWEFENVKDAIEKMRQENIRGFSVTIPFKVDVIEHLDEIDEVAKKIGAVNTVVNTDGVLKGYNTDWEGCVAGIEEIISLDGKNVLVIGAGGAARAVAFGMKEAGGKQLFIVNRTLEKAEELASEVGAEFSSLDDDERIYGFMESADVVINTTSVGLGINERVSADSDFAHWRGKSPINPAFLKEGMIVNDIVYKPKETYLLQCAKIIGAEVVTGDRMLLFQGAKQFELFAGKPAPVQVMAEALNSRLNGK